MEFRLLGRSGLRVSELCLGTMTFGEKWPSMAASKEESRAIFDAFVERGGNFLDTSNNYQMGESEIFVGEFVRPNREAFVIGTKYTSNMDLEDPNAGGNHRKNLVQSVEASLKRLQTDYIDILWIHAWDFLSPIEEVMRALDDLVRAGKVLYVGVSNTPAWIVAMANVMAELRSWSPFIGLQIQYNLIERTVERELLPMAKALDIGVAAWSPLGGGVLTGKYDAKGADREEPMRYGPDRPWGTAALNDRNLAIATEVRRIAEELGKTPAQVALNWLRQQAGRGVIIPVIGARTINHAKDNFGCLDFQLPAEHLERLNICSRVELGFPHDFIRRGEPNPFLYGNKIIHDHRDC